MTSVGMKGGSFGGGLGADTGGGAGSLDKDFGVAMQEATRR